MKILRKIILCVLSRHIFSDVTGLLVRISRPKFLVRAVINGYFIKTLGVHTDEIEKPVNSYGSVLKFFTRRLKPGARPVDTTAGGLISPVDGVITQSGQILDNHLFEAKNRSYPFTTLIPFADEKKYNQGHYITLYLSPADYHRIHHPVSAEITHTSYIEGRLLPVNAFSLQNFSNVLPGNRRIIITYCCQNITFYMVLVGALNVGNISILYDPSFYQKADRNKNNGIVYQKAYTGMKVEKGSEAAVFNLGSTVILIFPENTFVPGTTVRDSRIKMGQLLGTLT